MKRILVIDDSQVVQETLDLVLGREFNVLKRPLTKNGDPFIQADEEIDLLILGLNPAAEAGVSGLLRRAESAPFALLFLVDSKPAARIIRDANQLHIGCLSKPFNPYDLIGEVRRLVGGKSSLPDAQPAAWEAENRLVNEPYIEYPYISRVAASLVHRFAASRMPILILGELGCGQENVARAICNLDGLASSPIVINADEIAAGYIARKRRELYENIASGGTAVTLLINDIDRLLRPEQSMLLDFLEADRGNSGRWRSLTTTRTDLLEQVYRGNFLEALYYKLSTLTLKLPPLRDRKEDIAPIAEKFARSYAGKLGLGEVVLTPGAVERLSNYLWFGNLRELETVIARTLVIHGRTQVGAADVIFDLPAGAEKGGAPETDHSTSAEARSRTEAGPSIARSTMLDGLKAAPLSGNSNSQQVELNVLIHELAHELKNPMVTIKTFAQLLGDRYQDENFRSRFQDVVGDDIERMDAILEMMIEFSDFSRPRAVAFALEEKVRSAMRDMAGEFTKRQATIRWCGNSYAREIRADEDQIRYILKNTLVTVLSQIKTGSEFEVDVERQGRVAFSYLLEGARVRPITHYLNVSSGGSENTIWPLRILLAKHLIEQNGGRMAMDQSHGEREILTMEFPVA